MQFPFETVFLPFTQDIRMTAFGRKQPLRFSENRRLNGWFRGKQTLVVSGKFSD